jgi:peroxiredoxin
MGAVRALRYGLALLLLILFPAASPAVPRAGEPAPRFKAITTTGQEVSLESYRGDVLLLDFFATWCIPCRVSVPHVVEMKRKYGKQGLQVLGLSVDEDGEEAFRSFVSENRINYPLAPASEAVQSAFGIRSVPVMFVIDRRGVVSEIFRGFTDESGRSMELLVRRLLAERQGKPLQ